MEQRETYVQWTREALARQDVDRLEQLIEDQERPFWLRRDCLDVVMEADSDELAITVFNRLFLPLERSAEGERALLLEWWLGREARVAAPRRIAYLRRFLEEASGFAGFSDRLFNAVIGVLAAWMQQPHALAGWAEVDRVTRRFYATLVHVAPGRLVDPRMLRAALWSGDFSLMEEFLGLGAAMAGDAVQLLMLHYLLGTLVSFADRTKLGAVAEALHAKDPRHPIAINNLAQVWHAQCRDIGQIADLFTAIDCDAAPHEAHNTLNWIAHVCYEYGDKERAAALFNMLPAGMGATAKSWQRKASEADRAGFSLPPSAATRDMLELAGLAGILAQPLEQAASLVRTDMSWTSPVTAEELGVALERAILHVGAVPCPTSLVEDCVRAAQRMLGLGRAYFEPYWHYADATPIPFAEKYGRFDIRRLQIAYDGFMALAATVARIGLESILEGAPLPRMETCLRLLDHYGFALLAKGGARDALALLQRFEDFAPTRDLALALREKCHLALGDVAAAEALLAPTEQVRSETFALAGRDAWSRAEGVAWEPVFDDPPSTGYFEIVWPDGRLASYEHTVPATQVSVTRLDALTVRDGEILRGRNDLILRPARTHYPLSFPDRRGDIVACGAGAVRLLRAGPPIEVADPVVVLENFDALYHRNYFHWVVMLLSRVNLIRQLGMMDGRRLVVPEGMTAWMHATLRAIGIHPADLLVVPRGREMRLTDVWLLSSVEFASPTLLRSLCATILPMAGSDDGEPVHLFVSRRGQARRPFINEAEIEAMARDLGFMLVQPETMSFEAQAALFRRAASVAGPEGAAFTNTMFCRQGTRTLGMASENELFPSFNDLATLMGLPHRKLAGRPELDDYGVNYLWAPYSIDPGLAERELRWALEAGA